MERFLLLLTIVVFLWAPVAVASDATAALVPDSTDVASRRVEEPLFYAYLGEMPEASSGPVADLIVNKMFPGKSIQDTPLGMQKFRPMLQWRHWANQKQRFFPSLIFTFLVSFILWIPFGRRLDSAGAKFRQKFWRCLGSGVLVSVLLLFLARLLFLSDIGWPAGILTIAVAQLSLLAGLVVAVNLVGESIARAVRVTQIRFVGERPLLQRATFLFLGSLVLSGVLLIPGPMHLPPIGTRLILLFALLGLGALYKTQFDVER